MHTRQLMKESIQAIYSRTTWFVTFTTATESLSESQADWKQSGETNSIHEIVQHLNFYNHRYLEKFKGMEPEDTVGEIKKTFDNREQAWEALLAEAETIFDNWIAAIEASNDTTLEQWSSEISQIAMHNAYHIGQIVHIRKTQGWWKPEQGIAYQSDEA